MVSINSSKEVIKADYKSVSRSVLEIKKDNHFSGQTSGRDGEWEDREKR